MIYNVGSGSSNAEQINYDNTESELTATNVQKAIDEINENTNSVFSFLDNTEMCRAKNNISLAVNSNFVGEFTATENMTAIFNFDIQYGQNVNAQIGFGSKAPGSSNYSWVTYYMNGSIPRALFNFLVNLKKDHSYQWNLFVGTACTVQGNNLRISTNAPLKTWNSDFYGN